jgi:hypothetical protein
VLIVVSKRADQRAAMHACIIEQEGAFGQLKKVKVANRPPPGPNDTRFSSLASD